jgi:hypothetical protein
MVIDVTQPILDLDGRALLRDGKSDVSFTIRDAMTRALLHTIGNGAEHDAKYVRYQLAVRVNVTDRPELTADEIRTVRDAVSAAYGPLVVGRIYEATGG